MMQLIAYREHLSFSEIIYWLICISMVIGFAISLTVAFFDGRTIDGSVSVWAKPLKFELSLALHAATFALVMSALHETARTSLFVTLIAVIFLAACLVEMGYIISQAARGEASHFNISTPFARLMWSVMAFAAIVIVGAAGVMGLAVLFNPADGLAPTLKWAIVLGLVGGTLLTVYTAFTIGGRMSPYVGGVPDGSETRMMLTGWSLVAGDLRVSHFLATHMIQVLPLAGLVLAQFATTRAGVVAVVVAAVLWSGLTLYEYGRALGGNPSALALSAGSR